MDRHVKPAGLDLPQSRADEAEALGQLELERARQANRRLRRFNLVLVGVAAVAIVILIFPICSWGFLTCSGAPTKWASAQC